MCGIAGHWSPGTATARLEADARRMTKAVQLRGPDGDGHWVDEATGVALGHRRLAIIDLTPTGAQPMASADGRFVITYNGEVYNFQDLREELLALGATFRGTSDTEVLLEGFTRWGIEGTLRRCVGMFAMAVWDRRTGTLTLARDRFGEKPLYWGVMAGALLFGSDPAALVAHPSFQGVLDRTALALYLRLGYIPAPHCIYKGVRKVRPGMFLTFTSPTQAPNTTTYFDALAEAESAGKRGPPADATDDLDRLLRRTVRRSMVSDVPLGVFLSGGIDSSTVAALMQAESTQPVHTFTIGFDEAAYNEAADARRIAEHLGTQHTEFTVTADEARAVIPDLPRIYQEPFADSSQIPTFLVSRLARRHVTVALSGDGGDEVFGGYTRYTAAARLIAKLRRIPRPLRALAGRAILAVPDRALAGAGRVASPFATRRWRDPLRSPTMPSRAKRLGGLLAARDGVGDLLQLVSIWPDADNILVAPTHQAPPTAPAPGWTERPEEVLMLQDTVTYLPDDILAKVDRASMAVSLETRAPLLSHEVFAAAWQLPLEAKIKAGRGKLPLREVLQRYVPRELVERPKAGFAIPLADWLRGPLRDWAEALVSEERLLHDGLLEPAPIRQAWLEHIGGRTDNSARLWVILMLQAWLDEHPGMVNSLEQSLFRP